MEAQQVQLARRRRKNHFVVSDVDIGETPANRIRVKVQYSGLNYAEVQMRLGTYYKAPRKPFTPGYEVAGTVLDIGSDVPGWKLGDRVVAFTRYGGYATVVDVEPGLAAKVPRGMGLDVACSIPLQGLTAWAVLHGHGRIRAGDRVLVHGAAGGVGLMAAAIARAAGATVYGTVSTRERAQYLVDEHDVVEAFTYDGPWVERMQELGGAHVVLDAQGGKQFQDSIKALAPFGRVVSIGAAGMIRNGRKSLRGTLSTIRRMLLLALALLPINAGISGLSTQDLLKTYDPRPILEGQLTDVSAGRLPVPRIAKIFDLQDVRLAHAALESRTMKGKILLRVA